MLVCYDTTYRCRTSNPECVTSYHGIPPKAAFAFSWLGLLYITGVFSPSTSINRLTWPRFKLSNPSLLRQQDSALINRNFHSFKLLWRLRNSQRLSLPPHPTSKCCRCWMMHLTSTRMLILFEIPLQNGLHRAYHGAIGEWTDLHCWLEEFVRGYS